MELVPEGATAPVMGEVLQPVQEERAPVAAGEVEVITEQPEAAGRWFPALLGSRRNIGAEANAEAEPARDDAVGSVEVAGKWAGGRPPPSAPADLYTGPRGDELLSTEEISGEYSAACICVDGLFPVICNSMTVVPLGPDAIETWSSGCCFFPPLMIGPFVEGAVLTRNPGTNAFDWMTFSADGTAKRGEQVYKKRPGSQKRAFHKVETRDLAGNWCGCGCLPFVPLWPLSFMLCTRKKELNEDQYEESGLICFLCPSIGCVESEIHTRKYVNGHPTNGFDDGMRYRDPGCAAQNPCVGWKKLC